MTVVSQANPILGDLLKARESSSTLVLNISAWPVASPLQSPFPTTTASTLSYGLGTSVWSQSLHNHTSVHSREDCASLPVKLKMHQECNWCAPAALGCWDQSIAGPKDISLENWWPPASHHQLFHSTALRLLLEPLFSSSTFTIFFTCRAPWKRKALTQERVSDWVVMKPDKVVVNTTVGNLWFISTRTKQTPPVLSCNDVVGVNGCLGTV